MELQTLNREKKIQLLEAIDQGLVPAEYLRPSFLFKFDAIEREPVLFKLSIWLTTAFECVGSGDKPFTLDEYEAFCEDIRKKYEKRLMIFPDASSDIIIAVHPAKKKDPFPMEEKIREYEANREAAEKPVETIPDSELKEPVEKAAIEKIEVQEKEETIFLRRIYPPGL